jgi:hypothetical protein
VTTIYGKNHLFKASGEYTTPYHEIAYNGATKKSLEQNTEPKGLIWLPRLYFDH